MGVCITTPKTQTKILNSVSTDIIYSQHEPYDYSKFMQSHQFDMSYFVKSDESGSIFMAFNIINKIYLYELKKIDINIYKIYDIEKNKELINILNNIKCKSVVFESETMTYTIKNVSFKIKPSDFCLEIKIL